MTCVIFFNYICSTLIVAFNKDNIRYSLLKIFVNFIIDDTNIVNNKIFANIITYVNKFLVLHLYLK